MGNHSVSFLDVSQPGFAYGCAYLVTKKQFCEIWEQEGKSENWYNKLIELNSINGIKAYTFTNEKKRKFESVSNEYMKVLAAGLVETYPNKSEQEIRDYLDRVIEFSRG